MFMYGHCVSTPVDLLRSLICISRNETCEDSHTQSRLVCTNPSRVIPSLTCGMQDLIRALNKTHEITTRVVNLDMSCTVL